MVPLLHWRYPAHYIVRLQAMQRQVHRRYAAQNAQHCVLHSTRALVASNSITHDELLANSGRVILPLPPTSSLANQWGKIL